MGSSRIDQIFREFQIFSNIENKSDRDIERFESYMVRVKTEFRDKHLIDVERAHIFTQGIAHAKQGLAGQVDTIALVYQLCQGGPIDEVEIHTGLSNCSHSIQFKAWCIIPFLKSDEIIQFHEYGAFEIGGYPNSRYWDIFGTNQRIIFFGQMYLAVWGSTSHNIYLLAYPEMRNLPYHRGLDYIDIEKIREVSSNKLDIHFEADCEYVNHRMDGIPKPLVDWNWEKVKVKSGTLNFKITLPQSKDKANDEMRANALRDSIKLCIREQLVSSGANPLLIGNVKCSNCGATYKYQPKDIQPDGSVLCKNCLKPIS